MTADVGLDGDDCSWSWDESHDSEMIVDSSDHLDVMTEPVPGDEPIDSLPDDMGFENQVKSSGVDVGMIMNAAGWHPFMHFFVRLSNMLYGSVPETRRPNMLAYRHPFIFWLHLVLDDLFQIAVLAILLFVLVRVGLKVSA